MPTPTLHRTQVYTATKLIDGHPVTGVLVECHRIAGWKLRYAVFVGDDGSVTKWGASLGWPGVDAPTTYNCINAYVNTLIE